MKKKVHLSSRIFLINKKYKKNELYHYIQDPNNVITIPILKNNDLENSCIISSFNPFVLRRVRKLNPNIQIAYLWTKNKPQFIINTPLWIWWCKPDGFHADINLLDENLIKWIRRKNMTILAFTIINKKQLNKIQHLKLDGIFLDDPHLY